MSTVSATITPLRLAAVGTVLGALVACQGSGGSSGPSDTPLAAVSPHATAEATPTPTPRAPITVERTVDGVDGLASDGQTLVWGSGPGTELWTSRLDGSGQRRVWSAPHRQGFLSGFGLSGSWVVMTETLPPSSPNGQFPAAWYVWAVNLGDGTAVMLD